VHTTRQLSEHAASVLRRQMEQNESERAVGRCDYHATLSTVPKGSGYTFVLVTDLRILWTRYLGPERVYAERFSAIRSFSQGLYRHRWILLLRHGPSVRIESVSPKWYRPSSWHAPPTEAPAHRTETILELSRRQSVAANTIVSRFRELNIPEGEPLHFDKPHGQEPVVLTAVPRSTLGRWIRDQRLRRFRTRWR
jgi:hypothetical protein